MIVSCVVDEAVGTLSCAAVSNGTCTGACVAKRLAKWFRVASPFGTLLLARGGSVLGGGTGSVVGVIGETLSVATLGNQEMCRECVRR
jgi:hypothetical protein